MSLLLLDQVKKSYISPEGERQTVLDVPHFELEEQEQIALAGTSGSGKTTLLNVIAGILTPDSGVVSLSGVDLGRLSEARRDALRARSLGYVFQTFNLLQGFSALENVVLGMSFGPGPAPSFAKSLLVKLGLGHRLNHRPKQLSIGQQQRVALARALANRPKLVLADEPTGNLDPVHAQEALDLLRELCNEQGAALLVVSHDERILGQFEKVIDLKELNRAAVGAVAQ